MRLNNCFIRNQVNSIELTPYKNLKSIKDDNSVNKFLFKNNDLSRINNKQAEFYKNKIDFHIEKYNYHQKLFKTEINTIVSEHKILFCCLLMKALKILTIKMGKFTKKLHPKIKKYSIKPIIDIKDPFSINKVIEVDTKTLLSLNNMAKAGISYKIAEFHHSQICFYQNKIKKYLKNQKLKDSSTFNFVSLYTGKNIPTKFINKVYKTINPSLCFLLSHFLKFVHSCKMDVLSTEINKYLKKGK